ncbi:MAG: nucleotidyltransferase domain-containing protein [Magnetococcales bacterium]|nr:nucleotidyltransferase domain-containing protein [Magnetococcales bacterium]
MNEQPLVQSLRAALPNLLAVYLFGSRGSGDAGLESDLDLAVLVAGKVEPTRLWSLAGALADIAGCPVDLLDLRAASTVMQYQIVTTGRRVWERDARAALYESFILSEKTALDEARAPLLDRIRREGVVHGQYR